MGKERKYLYDIQGLRAVAALMVAVYHSWIQRVSGGVDVFFVVAAFFVVGSLTRRVPLSLADVRDHYGKTLRRLLVAITVVSLCYYITEKNRSWAYFDTFARAWEFALGGRLALGVSRVSLSPPAAKVLGWISLVVLTTFASFLDVSTLFPGVVALVPVLAAIGIVIGALHRAESTFDDPPRGR